LTNCAVRGIERSAARVSGVITEMGRVACESVVLAGGAWSRLFCRALDLKLPQLRVLASVLRTGRVEGGPSLAAWGPGLALRRRLDGGYTVSNGNVIADIVPDSFRFLTRFLPVLRMERKGISLRFGKPFLDDWRLSRPWRLDEISPFEKLRTIDPLPVAHDIARARYNLEQAFPVFRGAPTVATWGGLIDTTPDLLPVISSVDAIPGFYISTGYSGHGFGIGLGAGRLTADLVCGNTPLVDPAPFHFSRFTDGSMLRPQAGL
jgi:glycine/D-amino acid oxidase-like deaminating enzyme